MTIHMSAAYLRMQLKCPPLSYVSARQECCTVRYGTTKILRMRETNTARVFPHLRQSFAAKIGFTLRKVLTILRLLFQLQFYQ
jgi:hypothetical protein